MCGIAGFAGRRQVARPALEPVLRSLAQRGPDGAGATLFTREGEGWRTTEAGPVGLIHTRLSIRDLSTNGAQPMANEDGSVWVVFNGEVYGWEAERDDLERRGHVFRSRTDTEFLIHGYEEWGEGVLDRLRGMFAFAILDLRRERLFCARDRLGKKPFYHAFGPAGFAFASTLHALRAVPLGLPFELDPEGVDAFLAHRYIPAPRTLYRGAGKLPAGHKLTYEWGRRPEQPPVITAYWQPQPQAGADVVAQLRTAVGLRLVSDRPVGLFLSGGIDSRAVGKALAEAKVTINAFTAGFPDAPPGYDETTEAAEAARRYRLPHQVLPIRMQAEDLPRILRDMDEPFADPSAIPTWYLCREASRAVTVALTGDGGDELFAGYKRYAVHLRTGWRRGLPTLPGNGFRAAAPLNKRTLGGRLRRVGLEWRLRWTEAYALRFSGLDPLTRAFLQPGLGQVQAHYWRLPAGEFDPLGWMLECDWLNYLPDYILRKGDLCGMAHGLELRNPLLDHVLAQGIMGLPAAERFTSPTKRLLRTYLGETETVQPKRGFNPPLETWLRAGWLADRIQALPADLSRLTSGQLGRAPLETMVRDWRDRRVTDEVLWQLLVLTEAIRHLEEN